MSGESGGSRQAGRGRTRRSLLRAGLGTITAAGAATGGASAQGETPTGTPQITRKAVIPEQQEYGQDVVGFWIHIGPEVDPVESSVADRCEFVDWADDETLAYDARLIDKSADPQESAVTLYLHDRVEISPGTLFIVNDVEQCEGGYVGLRVERVGMDLETIRAREPASPTEGGGAEGPDGTGGAGPGPGVVGALAALAGVGWLLGRDSRE